MLAEDTVISTAGQKNDRVPGAVSGRFVRTRNTFVLRSLCHSATMAGLVATIHPSTASGFTARGRDSRTWTISSLDSGWCSRALVFDSYYIGVLPER